MGSWRMGISDFFWLGYGAKWVRLVFFILGRSRGDRRQKAIVCPTKFHGGTEVRAAWANWARWC